jgi:hypothetical protein
MLFAWPWIFYFCLAMLLRIKIRTYLPYLFECFRVHLSSSCGEEFWHCSLVQRFGELHEELPNSSLFYMIWLDILEQRSHNKANEVFFLKYRWDFFFFWLHPKFGIAECRTTGTFSTFGTEISPSLKKGKWRNFREIWKKFDWNLATQQNDLRFPF